MFSILLFIAAVELNTETSAIEWAKKQDIGTRTQISKMNDFELACFEKYRLPWMGVDITSTPVYKEHPELGKVIDYMDDSVSQVHLADLKAYKTCVANQP